MKKMLFSTVLAGALLLQGVGIASAGQRGWHGGFAPHYRFVGPGFGWGYYGYNPYWYGGYPYPYAVPAGVVTGGLRLEIPQKNAQVFVDGAYAGIVDDFDGHFQHLNLTPGRHQVETRLPGFQTMTFNTYVQPDHTTDLKATMVPAPGTGR
jgi:hypothetical protein